jgi:hypothetical protein
MKFWPHAVLVLALVAGSSLLRAQGVPDSDRWPFAPAHDDFRTDALLDLRSLNEKTAGETGFVKTDGKGGFLRGDGQELRFWAVGSFVLEDRPWKPRPLWPEKTAPSLTAHARFLAKHGVNLARAHFSLNPDTKKNPTAKLEDFNQDIRDYVWEFVAAMKQAGIYSMITPYWAAAFKPTESMGFGTDNAHALLFFDPRLKAAYKTWLRALLVPPNPHTGIPLAKDPGLAIIQIQNEDSTLFWTMNVLKGQELDLLAKQFSEWVVKHHGSAEAALKAWDNTTVKGDEASAGHFQLIGIYDMTLDHLKPGRAARLADQLHFWSDLMFDFHREIVSFLRDECGCQQLISGGNWHTADTVRMNDALRWTYTATDIQGVNRYFPGVHSGQDAGWNIQPGQVYNSRSFLTHPFDWPLQVKLPVNQPFVITESSWTFPSMTSSEGPLLVAAYQSLTGFDALAWFAFGSEQWTPPQSANGYKPNTQGKFIAAFPDCLGQFPAAALIFRNGYVKQGEPVIHEARPLEDIWNRCKPIAAETGGYDSRTEHDGPQAPRAKADPRAFFVGPVEVEYGADASKTKIADLSAFIDDKDNVVHSNTGEHTLDLGKASFTLNTPCAQGVAAFFKNQHEFKLADVTIKSGNDYGACAVVSMDRKPLRESTKVLVQVGTTSRPAGWKDSPAPADDPAMKKKGPGGDEKDLRRVDDVGHAPWMVERGKFTVSLKNSRLSKATALDANGYAKAPVELKQADGGVSFNMPEDALYVILE